MRGSKADAQVQQPLQSSYTNSGVRILVFKLVSVWPEKPRWAL